MVRSILIAPLRKQKKIRTEQTKNGRWPKWNSFFFRTFLATVGRQSTGHARCRKVALAAAFSNCRTSAPRVNAMRGKIHTTGVQLFRKVLFLRIRMLAVYANTNDTALKRRKLVKKKKIREWKWKLCCASDLSPILNSTATFSFVLLFFSLIFLSIKDFHVTSKKNKRFRVVLLLLANVMNNTCGRRGKW